MINRFPEFSLSTNKCTGSLQFIVNDYLALLVIFLIRRVRHLKQVLVICSYACVADFLSTFDRETLVLVTVF